jgi:hypothetical protein
MLSPFDLERPSSNGHHEVNMRRYITSRDFSALIRTDGRHLPACQWDPQGQLHTAKRWVQDEVLTTGFMMILTS